MAVMTLPCGRKKMTVGEGMRHIPRCRICSAWVVKNVPPREERKTDADREEEEE